MSPALNFLIYFISYTFIIGGSVNFFLPISEVISLAIILISILFSWLSALFIPFDTFARDTSSLNLSKRSVTLILALIAAWTPIVIWRPTVGDDAIGYHLPLSLLMNHSIWYPGIAKLSSHYGFPNGISVVSSVFTAFEILSLENIPNLIIWYVLGSGIFLYLASHGASPFQSGVISLIFILSPDMFWQSYNMGTDLPSACFLAFGLLALADRRWNDSYLFLALSATFKTLGAVAVVLVTPYLLFIKERRQGEFQILHLKTAIAILLLTVSVLRIYIATGNPFYPALPVNLANWGISSAIQETVINGVDRETGPGLTEYVGIERTFLGYLAFAVYFLFFPYRVKSSYWFSPFLIAGFAVGIYYFVKEKYYRTVSVNAWYLFLVVQVLLMAWFFYSPVFRFAAGVFIFLGIELFLFCKNHMRSWLPRLVINGAMAFTLSLFTLNVFRHVDQNIIAVLRHTPEAVSKWMPWEGPDRDKLSTKYTDDGFIYSKADAMYCQRMHPPCISMRSLADEPALIREYRKYNRY
jgi:hypothetical protein